MPENTSSVFTLAAGTQSYDWGKLGKESKAAQLAQAAAQPEFVLDERKPYAELWMGTHVSLPSKVTTSAELLSDHLKAHPELMGSKVAQKFTGAERGNLPFLFKILSIRKALSIQAHPDKALAEKLHAQRPDIYKDDNHKPEMAIALTPFLGLCGFRPLRQIANFLRIVPELAALVPPMIQGKFSTVADSPNPTGPSEKAALREVWAALMTAEPEQVRSELSKLITRYKSRNAQPDEEDLKEVAITIESQFPGDIGVFCIFVLNKLEMEAGEAMFLAAGEPHAYLSGDIVETMATSDNVLRAGLTPKLRDVPNLVSSLTYNSSAGSKHAVTPTPYAPRTKLYDPPIPEFSVLCADLEEGDTEDHQAIEGPSIAIVTKGNGGVKWASNEVTIREGAVFFVAADTPITLRAGTEGLQLYRAFVEA